MAEHINKTDTLNEGRVKLNAAISDAETAKVTAEGADVKSSQALANSESTQTQLDTIVIEGDSSVEAAQARVDEKGEGHATLKARIDDGFEKTSSQLADKANQDEFIITKEIRDFVRYGKIYLPEELPTLPFELYRGHGGIINHNHNFEGMISGTDLYVDCNGSDANDGLSTETPLRSINKALEIANGYSAVIINMMGYNGDSELIDQNTATPNSILSTTCPKVTIQPYEKDYMWFTRSNLRASVTQDQNTYKINASVTLNVYDLNFLDYRDMPRELKKVNTFAECNSTKGTWYTDGTTVWVRTLDDRQPDITNDLIVSRKFSGWYFSYTNTQFIFKNIGFAVNSTEAESHKHGIWFAGTSASELWARNVKVLGGLQNGFYVNRIKNTYLFNCTATKQGRDGFNYHGNGGINPYEFVFEFNCHAYELGLDGGDINNATTAHDGLTILRVASVGYNTNGPVLADVNGCYSYNIDCVMYDSTRTLADREKTAFWFNNEGAEKQGKAFLINCQGGGVDTFGISSDGLIDVFVQNFNGNKINNTDLKFIA